MTSSNTDAARPGSDDSSRFANLPFELVVLVITAAAHDCVRSSTRWVEMSDSDHHQLQGPRGTVRPRAHEPLTTPTRQGGDVYVTTPGDTPARRKMTKIIPSGDGVTSMLQILPPDRTTPTRFGTLDLPEPVGDDFAHTSVPPNMKARQILSNWSTTVDMLDDICWIAASQHWTTGDLDLIEQLYGPSRSLFRHLARLRQRAGIVDDGGDDVEIITDPGAAAPSSFVRSIPHSPFTTPTKPSRASMPPKMLVPTDTDPHITPKATRSGPSQPMPDAPPTTAAPPPGRAPPQAPEPRSHADAPRAGSGKPRPNEPRRSRSKQAQDRPRTRATNAHAVPPSKNRPHRSINRLVCSFVDPLASLPGPRPRPHPASLVAAVNRALPAPLVSAVDYSRMGRLVLVTTDPVRASQLLPHDRLIRRALQEVFKLPDDTAISLELDVEWTRLVIHNAPLPIGSDQDMFWPALCAAAGLDFSVVKQRRFLCARDELDRRLRDSSATNGQAVSVMLAISDPKAASRLLRTDVLWEKTLCHTSLYRARSPRSS